eukprot:TRINITY_DN5847_c3_g1_i1.p1 TRINITY_DN5847_c3_g1~~TRINITY_DN5847_c3_g1_i1.p1  ORF type:complete len:469 (+),score=135.48 TRINITY_DN5847_c3_g1_i1:340-1746(+)
MTNIDDLAQAIDFTFVAVNSFIIFLMQLGFAFLEAGSVRSKNVTSILLKNIIDAALGGIVYWACGYAFAYGTYDDNNNPFIGYFQFFLSETRVSEYIQFFFQYVFAATASTITSGCMAERTHIHAYIVFTILFTGFAYPIATHWTWSEDGWLADLDYVDFAGSSLVHCIGGVSGLVGAILVGARIGRFEEGKTVPIPGHSTVLVTIGFFILWFGFFSFNACSTGSITSQESFEESSRAMINTTLGGCGGAITALLLKKISLKKSEIEIKEDTTLNVWHIFGGSFSLIATVNGGLAGMVAICAGANVYQPWGGFIVGIIGAILYIVCEKMIILFKIDDPLNAAPVHLGAGIWGTLAVSIFANDKVYDNHLLENGGILYSWSGNSFLSLGIQAMGLTVIILWASLFAVISFLPLKILGLLRVSPQIEEEGIDFNEGEPAYPIDPRLIEDLYGIDEEEDDEFNSIEESDEE